MAIRPKVVRRKVEEDEMEDFEEVEEEPVVKKGKVVSRRQEPEEDEDDGYEVDEDEEEEEEPAPKSKVTKKVVVPPAPIKKARPIVEEDEDEDEEEEPAPKAKKVVVPPAPIKKAAAPVKKAARVDEDEEEEPAPKTVKVKSVGAQVVDDAMSKFMEALDNGKSLVISKIADNKWQVGIIDTPVTKARLAGKEYDATIHTSEYLEWVEGWKKMTSAEKVAFAKKHSIEYPKHDDARVEAIGLAEAVMTHLGIEKYKPEYERPSVRRALRGK